VDTADPSPVETLTSPRQKAQAPEAPISRMTAATARPTFCVFDDDAGHVRSFGPEEYLDYEYSEDGAWLYLTLEDGDTEVRESFYIGYPA
jgi:hypothetical protein